MFRLLDNRYASSRTVSRMAVHTQIFRMAYSGQNMSSYVYQYTSLFARFEHMSQDAAIPESYKAPMMLASIDPNCAIESTASALRTREIGELIWDYVVATLIDEYNSKQLSAQPSGRTSRGNDVRNDRRKRHGKNSSHPHKSSEKDNMVFDDNSDIESTVRAIAAAIQTVISDVSGASNSFHWTFVIVLDTQKTDASSALTTRTTTSRQLFERNC